MLAREAANTRLAKGKPAQRNWPSDCGRDAQPSDTPPPVRVGSDVKGGAGDLG
jgi:hypothetical protein